MTKMDAEKRENTEKKQHGVRGREERNPYKGRGVKNQK